MDLGFVWLIAFLYSNLLFFLFFFQKKNHASQSIIFALEDACNMATTSYLMNIILQGIEEYNTGKIKRVCHRDQLFIKWEFQCKIAWILLCFSLFHIGIKTHYFIETIFIQLQYKVVIECLVYRIKNIRHKKECFFCKAKCTLLKAIEIHIDYEIAVLKQCIRYCK